MVIMIVQRRDVMLWSSLREQRGDVNKFWQKSITDVALTGDESERMNEHETRTRARYDTRKISLTIPWS